MIEMHGAKSTRNLVEKLTTISVYHTQGFLLARKYNIFLPSKLLSDLIISL